MTKDEALDKKADNAMIYKTFEQWMNGDFLEVGEPRKKAYSEDELLLVEMGWNYGYDAGRAVEQALDKKAENARELGLMPFYGGDYEPVCNKDPQGCWNVRCQLGKKCKNTSAQQEPVACECHRCIDEKGLNVNGLPLSMTKMILCPECGNKRCPKASDHRLACTNSNDLGQPGSIYTSPPAEQQEPVAWMTKTGSVWKNKADETDTPLYTSPPAQRTWVGLSDAEIHNMTILMGFNPEWVPEVEMVKSIVRNLEAKLKEKNT